jgi:hypothetical protein
VRSEAWSRLARFKNGAFAIAIAGGGIAWQIFSNIGSKRCILRHRAYVYSWTGLRSHLRSEREHALVLISHCMTDYWSGGNTASFSGNVSRNSGSSASDLRLAESEFKLWMASWAAKRGLTICFGGAVDVVIGGESSLYKATRSVYGESMGSDVAWLYEAQEGKDMNEVIIDFHGLHVKTGVGDSSRGSRG